MNDGRFKEGNTFGLKWSLPEIEKKVDEINLYMTEDKQGEKIIYIGELISKCGLYADAWKYIEKVIQKPIGVKPENESAQTKERRKTVFRLIKKISTEMQSRLISRVLHGKANTAMGIFILKNQGWSDQRQLDVSSKGEKIMDGDISVTINNSNDRVKFDDKGNVTEDNTSEGTEG